MQNQNIDRPFDMLNQYKGEIVDVLVTGQKDPLSGELITFDININLIIKQKDRKYRFIRGGIVETIVPWKAK